MQDLDPDLGWSKEALFGLLAIFVMILLSGLSLAWKYGLLAKVRCIRRNLLKSKTIRYGACTYGIPWR